MKSHPVPDLLLQIAGDIRGAGGRSYLVGGWVRDHLLGLPSRDFDVEVYGIDEPQLLDLLRPYGKASTVGKAFGVINLARRGVHMDFSFPRTESKVGTGHRGFSVRTDPWLDFPQASLRRDFTINAMGMELPDLRLEDPHGGREDLQRRVLRHVGPAFAEDSLRVLRAVQFAARFDLQMDPGTVELCRSLDLRDLSRERIHEEFRKWLLKSECPSIGLRWFQAMDLSRFFPEIHPSQSALSWEEYGVLLDAAARLSEGLDAKEREIVLFGALCLPAGARGASAFLERLTQEIPLLRRIPPLIAEVSILLDVCMEGDLSDEDLRRVSVRVPPCLLLPLARAWQLALTGQKWPGADKLEHRWKSLGVWMEGPVAMLLGRDLVDLGMTPGPAVGALLRRAFEEQLRGNIHSSDQARAWARGIISSGRV